MEQTNNTTSTKGKGLGLAGMIVGIVALVWAVIPYLGAGALWIGIIGLVLSVIAFFMAKSGNNPKKGMIITGIILSVVAVGLAGFWIYKIKQAADAFGSAMESSAADWQKQIDEAAKAADTTMNAQ